MELMEEKEIALSLSSSPKVHALKLNYSVDIFSFLFQIVLAVLHTVRTITRGSSHFGEYIRARENPEPALV